MTAPGIAIREYPTDTGPADYAIPTLTREERATRAKVGISTRFNPKQRAFLDFVLFQYIRTGVEELSQEKLPPLLRLKYNNSMADAMADLGKPEEVGKIFVGFQKYLYQLWDAV